MSVAGQITRVAGEVMRDSRWEAVEVEVEEGVGERLGGWEVEDSCFMSVSVLT
jgi:hypothetical protein